MNLLPSGHSQSSFECDSLLFSLKLKFLQFYLHNALTRWTTHHTQVISTTLVVRGKEVLRAVNNFFSSSLTLVVFCLDFFFFPTQYAVYEKNLRNNFFTSLTRTPIGENMMPMKITKTCGSLHIHDTFID